MTNVAIRIVFECSAGERVMARGPDVVGDHIPYDLDERGIWSPVDTGVIRYLRSPARVEVDMATFLHKFYYWFISWAVARERFWKLLVHVVREIGFFYHPLKCGCKLV